MRSTPRSRKMHDWVETAVRDLALAERVIKDRA
jgi:hypothetical protein